MGVGTASTSGGLEFGQRELHKLWGQGWEHVSAYMSFAWYYAVNTGQISIRHGMRGPGGVVIAEQAGGLDAIGYARRQLAKGTSLMVTGGMDGTLCPYGLTIQVMDQALSRCGDPAAAYLPFDSRASGYVVGEGGAILVIESQSAALARGAPDPYGRIAGYGAAFDPDPASGDGLARAARTALEQAELAAADIDLVVADAAGVRDLDSAEASVISGIFGPGRIPVAVPKTATGRLLSGGAALDVATALLALRHGLIPPGVNVRRPEADPRLDLILDTPRAASLRTAMVLARGHGGFASAMVVSR
jgi:act minimal PKS chain-length factor (CLF/KS beta)